jgi:hypothetical protein
VHHPKDQHKCTHIQTLSHWNALTLSLWEVTYSSRVNIFSNNISYFEPIIESLQFRYFSILNCLTPTGSRPKVLGKSVFTLTLDQIKGINWGESLSLNNDWVISYSHNAFFTKARWWDSKSLYIMVSRRDQASIPSVCVKIMFLHLITGRSLKFDGFGYTSQWTSC